jgi:hypothetical protein
MSELIQLDRLNVRRLAADYSAAIRLALTDLELANVRGRNEAEADPEIDHANDYVETNELMAEAVLLQRPRTAAIVDFEAEMTEANARAKATGFRLSRILVGCEFSATVRDTFAARGHDVMSCDILPSDNPAGQHYEGDVRDVLNDGWHIGIMHPPCTYIAACQLWRCLPQHAANHPGRAAKKAEALEFVRDIGAADIEKMCVENPKSCIGTAGVLPGFVSQMVQPNRYGHDHSKETYLWLRDLPELVDDPANHIEGRDAIDNNGNPCKRWANQCDGSGADRKGPSPTRGHERSRFFQGFADAMADQWGGILKGLNTAKVLKLGQMELFA